jgi:hypothetical protein
MGDVFEIQFLPCTSIEYVPSLTEFVIWNRLDEWKMDRMERWIEWKLVMSDVSENRFLPRIASIYEPVQSGIDVLKSDWRVKGVSIENIWRVMRLEIRFLRCIASF